MMKKWKIKNLRVFLFALTTSMTLSMTGCSKQAKELSVVEEYSETSDATQPKFHYGNIQHLEFVEKENSYSKKTYYETQMKEDSFKNKFISTSYNFDEFQDIVQQSSNLESLNVNIETEEQLQVLNKIVDKNNIHSLIIRSSVNIDLNNLKDFPNLTQLSIDGRVSNTDSLMSFSNLTKLELTNAGISDINFLAKLTRLKILNLKGNRISDIQILKNQPELSILNLDNNENLKNVDVLEQCLNLQYLSLSKTNIKSIEALRNLVKLEYLFLNYNRIEDFSPIENLIKLRFLEMTHTGIEDLQVLEKLKELETLDLEDNGISNPTILNTNHPKLKHLYIGHNYISELEIIKLAKNNKLPLQLLETTLKTNNQYQNIIKVEVENTESSETPYKIKLLQEEKESTKTIEILTDNIYKVEEILSHNDNIQALVFKNIDRKEKANFLKKIKNPNNITVLYLGCCEAEVLEELPKFKNIKGLGVETTISNFDFLNNLTRLENLQIQGLPGSYVENMEVFRSLERLKVLYLDNCGITDIDQFENLTNLEVLSLYDNEIEKIEVMKNFQNLKYLDLRKNKIKDITPIYEIAYRLETLALSENCIPKTSFEELKEYHVHINEEAINSQNVNEEKQYRK